MIYNAGLVLEGGGTRGTFTDGVLDRLMELDIEFKVMTGVSAGACNGASFKSRQKTRAFHALADFIQDDRYCGIKCFLKTGDIFGKQMVYYDVPERLLPFDNKTYMENPCVFYVVATNVRTGRPEYFRVDDGFRDIEMIRASASIPLLSKLVPLDVPAENVVVSPKEGVFIKPGDVQEDFGASSDSSEGTYDILGKVKDASGSVKDSSAGEALPEGSRVSGIYLDGGITDSIPLRFSETFFDKNVVIETRPADYVKEPQSSANMLFARTRYTRYKDFVASFERRHEVYNAETVYVKEREEAGACFAIRPPKALPVGKIERDPEKLKAGYDMGYEEAKRREADLLRFLETC